MAGRRTDRAVRRWALAAAGGVVVLAAAGWLRALTVPYLIVAAGATAVLLALALARPWRAGPPAIAHAALAALALAFTGVASLAQSAMHRATHDWAAVERATVQAGTRTLARELDAAARVLRAAAREALDAPEDPAAAFTHVAARHATHRATVPAEWSLVLERAGRPVAWAGIPRVPPDDARAPASASAGAFYLVAHLVEARGGARAVASLVVHADAPADRLARALDADVAARTGVRRFAFSPADAGAPPAAEGAIDFAPAGTSLFTARALAPVRGEVELQLAERARLRGGLVAAALLAAFLAAVWPRPTTLARRLASLGVALAAVALVPLSAYSNASPIFDPLYYFAPLGGPFTANAGALGLTSALVLLALVAIVRWRTPIRSRALASAAVLVVAALGPFLLRDLARGITLPRGGVSPALWLAWEVTIFLAACAVLLAGASAGRVALGDRRGLPPAIAPALAALAALLAQPLLDPTGRFPGWYAAAWIAAIGALALTRRTRGLVFAAATVAGFGAATLVWGTTVRKRVDLARRDVAGITRPDGYARSLLARFAGDLAAGEPVSTRAGLLKRLTASDLAAAGFPVALTARDAGARLTAVLATAPGLDVQAREAVDSLVASAGGAPGIRLVERTGAPGAALLALVPHADGGLTTIAVGSRTQLLGDDPFASLYGIGAPSVTEPPYRLTLGEAARGARDARADADGRWAREGLELHGNWLLPSGADGRLRAHAEVDLRSLDALVQRGALVVLLDLAIVALLWGASAFADGGLPRWLAARRGGWTRSYRTRLTVALFAFFVIPAMAFAVWSYRRLQSDDREARALLVRESLRSVVPAEDFARLEAASARVQAPLLVFEGGVLAAASDTLLVQLAPVGRLVRADVQRALVHGDEPMTTRDEPLGRGGILVGYRAVHGASGIVAAPARAGELALDRRRRDLGVLVLFATAVGGLAALWLSGLAARELARPIATLREAALAIAAGGREPIPDGAPPGEFAPVFSAFRRMAADLAGSRSALEEAQRRTEAVLRNVASGVVAVDGDGAVVLANPRAESLLTCAIEAGASLDCLRAPDVEGRLARFVATGADEEEFDAEVGTRQLKFRLTRLARGGAVLTLDDVTELARAQRVLAWGEMARQVAHEIKNPLTPIRLGVQHLRRAHADGRPDFDRILGQNVERILGEIDRLDEIARAFSRYGMAPTERPAAAPTDVAAVLRGVLELERMGEGTVSWSVEGADDAVVALAREDELHEVLLNLLENARLAGARSVRSSVEPGEDVVRLVVRDDGDGIGADVLPRIFEPHFSTRTSGSGLGLAISRRMIEGWGGTITAASVVGAGTTMTIALRRLPDASAASAAPEGMH